MFLQHVHGQKAMVIQILRLLILKSISVAAVRLCYKPPLVMLPLHGGATSMQTACTLCPRVCSCYMLTSKSVTCYTGVRFWHHCALRLSKSSHCSLRVATLSHHGSSVHYTWASQSCSVTSIPSTDAQHLLMWQDLPTVCLETKLAGMHQLL